MSDAFYTHGHDRVVVSAHAQRSVADSAAFLLPYLDGDVDLLDFGCGPGSITGDLANYVGAGGTVIGIDDSADAISVATRHDHSNRVRFEVASVYELPFSDDIFDVAYGHQVLQHLADPVRALREVKRVLRPGGLVAVRDGDFGTMTHHPHYDDLANWRDLYREVARSNGGEPDAGRRLQTWVGRAGFVDIVATTSTWDYTTRERRSAWAQMWADRIRLRRFAERATALGRGDEIEPAAEAWLQWAQEPDGWFSLIHGEVVAAKPGT